MNERDIFIEAMQRPEKERSTFLNKVCGGNGKLRERVDALLNEELDSFLEGPAYQLNDTPTSSDAQQNIGKSIGPYMLMEQIGEGGFGLVFVAEQREPVRRRVALKLIKPGMDSKEVIARFEAERQALALMDHPNIARVLDAGTTDSGRPYFVMDLVRGIPITTFCDENQLSPTERLNLFLPICRAVQHAHQKGIIHRDIKPSNLLVTMNDGEPVPKVIDFGVAKALNQQLTQHTVYTRYSQMIGTPLYMSPEQAEMSSVDVDTRSDIYSLGVLLYELLTGSTPFDREQLSQAAFDEVRRIIREEEPPKPSTRLSQSGERLRGLAAQRKTEPTKLSKMLSGELDWIVMKALEKDRSRRYETANGFAADVQRYLNNETVVACPPTTAYRLRKFARKNKTLMATTTFVMAALLLGTIVSLWQANRALESEAEMRTSREQLQQQVYASAMNQASYSLAGDDLYRMRELLNQHIPESPEQELRGFEWYLLWKAGHHFKGWARNTNILHFQDLAVSPDGQILAAVDLVRATVHVYDRDLNLICSPLQIRRGYDELRFSPDGRFLISADTGGTSIRVFNTTNWAHSRTLHSASNCAIAVARDQPLMATAGPGEIMLWDTNTWKQTGSLPVSKEAKHVHHLAMHPDGTKLACALWIESDGWKGKGPIDFWDLTTKEIVRIFPPRTHRDGQDDLIAFSPDGKLLAIGGIDGWVRIWWVDQLFDKTTAPKLEREFPLQHAISALAFSPNSKKLALVVAKDESSVSTPDALQVWDLEKRETKPIPVFQDHSKQITDVSFVGDSNTICSIAYDGTLKLWNLTDSLVYDVIDGVEATSGAGYTVGGEIIYQDDKGYIRSWSVKSRRSVPILDTEQTYSRIAISRGGSTLAGITSDQKKLRIWDLATEREISTSTLDLLDLRERVKAHGGGPNNRLISLLRVSNDGLHTTFSLPLRGYGPRPALVVVVDAKSGKVIDEVCVHMSVWAAPAFSPSGKELVTPEYFTRNTVISEVEWRSLTPRLKHLGRGIPIASAFSPDGNRLAIGNHRNEIHLVNAADGNSLQILKGHTQWPTCVAFSQDGKHLVSSALDGTVRIWRRWSEEFHLVSTLQGHAANLDIHGVAVAPDGNSLFAVNAEREDDTTQSPWKPSVQGIIQVWRMASPDQVKRSVYDQLADDYTDLDQTLQTLNEALVRSPENLPALNAKAVVDFKRGEWKSAVDDLTVGLELARDNLHFLESRAKSYMLGQQWTDALADWEKLVELTNESNGRYLLGRGECHLLSGRRQEAHADLVKALAHTASIDTIERAIAFLQFAEPVFPTATQWRYKTGTNVSANWASAGFDDQTWKIGWAPFGDQQRYMLTRTDASFQDVWLRKTISLDRDIEAPLVLHLRTDEEVDVFINGILATPLDCTPNYLHKTREWSDYRRVYRVVPCSDDVPPLRKGENVIGVHCHNRVGSRSFVDVGLYVENDEADTESKLDAATELAPENSTLHTALAIRNVERRNWRKAAFHFHSSAQISPANGLPTWMWAALTYHFSGESDRYHELVAEMIQRFENTDWTGNVDYDGSRISPINDLAAFAKASVFIEPSARNLPAIEKMVNRALEAKPASSSAILAKALFEYRIGKPEAAIDWAKKCSPDDRGAAGVLALCYTEMGELELAHKKMSVLTNGLDPSTFHAIIRQNDEAHELAFVALLLEELKQKLTQE